MQIAIDNLGSLNKLELLHIESEDELLPMIFADTLLNRIADFASLKDIESTGAVSEHIFQTFAA
jgi:hypothetical protein